MPPDRVRRRRGRALRRADAVAVLAALAFAGALAWAERPPAPPSYFQGTWRRANPECAGGEETIRLAEKSLRWSDAAGHSGRARVRFKAANRFEGVLVEIEGLAAPNPSPTACGVKEGLRAAVYLLPTPDGGWIFRDDPERPWRRAE